MHSTLTFEHVCQVEQIRCVLNLPLPSEDEQGSDSSASQGSKGKESSSTKSPQASSALEHPHQGHHAIDALKLDIYWARRDFEKAVLELSSSKKRTKVPRGGDAPSSADANPVVGGQSSMSDVHSGDEDEGSSQKGIKECLDKCRWLEQLHRDEIEVRVWVAPSFPALADTIAIKE